MSNTSAMLSGLLPAGMYPTDTMEQIEYKTRYADAAFVFCEGMKHYSAYEKMIDACPKMIAIVVWACAAPVAELKRKDGTTVKVMSWDDIAKYGAEQPPAAIDSAISSCDPTECCAIVFTSGTTGINQ
jgi:long-subunit acyl-CoA synthetase (AMP-forming)